jgi:hypothetical protein
VSPVVGTVLLVAIVVALSALVAAVAFGTGGPREPAPDVVLELEQTDRPVAHELVVEGGDTLVGEKVEFRGTADEDPLAGRLRAGESVTVYPVEDTVRVVWFGEYTTTQILATFDPDPDLPPVDEGCNWVESTTGGHTNPVTVDVVVDCNVETEGAVDVVDPGVVIGDVDSYDNAVDLDHGTVYGFVRSDSAVDLDRTLVSADVTAGGDVTITDESTVRGAVETGPSGSIDADGGSQLGGPVVAGDDVALDSVTVGVVVRGPDVDISDSTVEGSVVGSNGVQLDGVTVTGHVYAPSGSFSCSDSTINGQDCVSYTPRDPDEFDG